MNIIGNVCFWHGLGLALFAQISGTFFANKNESIVWQKQIQHPSFRNKSLLKKDGMSRVPRGGNSALHSANCPRLNILLMKF